MRAEAIKKHIDLKLSELSELEKMGTGVEDKINIHTGDSSMAMFPAMLAAMQNAGGGQAGLSAAMAAMGNNGGGFGGNNGIWPIVLLALLGRGGAGGLFGGGADGAGVAGLNNLQGTIDTNTIMQALADIKAAVPLAEGNLQNSILQQTIALQNDISSGNMNVVDKITTGFAGIGAGLATLGTAQAVGFGQVLANSDRNAWTIDKSISNDGEKTRALVVDQNEKTRAMIGSIDRENLNRIITTQANELAELRGDSRLDRRSREVEVNVTQQVNQQQAQAQQQQQFVQLNATLAALAAQVNRSQQDIISVGSVLSGVRQESANTNVR